MARYVAVYRPLFIETPLWNDPNDNSSNCRAPDVDGPKAVDTGLITLQGDPIMRLQPPIGFGRDGEWQ